MALHGIALQIVMIVQSFTALAVNCCNNCTPLQQVTQDEAQIVDLITAGHHHQR